MVGKTESRFDLSRDFSVLAIPFQSINGLLHIAAKCWINTFRYNTSCARGDTIWPRPSPPRVGAVAPRAAEPTAAPADGNVAAVSHAQYAPTLTAAAACA